MSKHDSNQMHVNSNRHEVKDDSKAEQNSKFSYDVRELSEDEMKAVSGGNRILRKVSN